VIEIARGEVGLDGDLAHAGRREATRAKDPGCRPENLDPASTGST
jgi:hypothetical protein